ERMEARLRAHFCGEKLVDRRTAGAAPGVGGAGHQSAERGEMPVALAVETRGHVVDTADDVDVVLHGLERGQTRRQLVIRPGGFRYPVALGNSIAVKPDEEARFNRLAAFPGRSRIGGS